MDPQLTSTEPCYSYHSLSPPSQSSASVVASTVPITTSNTTATTPPEKSASTGGPSSSLPRTSHAASIPLDGSVDLQTPPTHSASIPAPAPSFPPLLPYWLPQHNLYYAQLLHYNKLVSPFRGGGLQGPPLPPVVSSSNAQAAPRSRSSSKVSLKDGSAGKGPTTGGHGSRSHHNPDKNRSVMTPKDPTQLKMPPKHSQPQALSTELSKNHSKRAMPGSTSQQESQPLHSCSVPTTPHQRARKFSFNGGSREPSPDENRNNHSPRSAYSEANSTMPSLPKQACRYEGISQQMRRRIPYSVGDEKLEKIPLGSIKGKLTADEENKLGKHMQEVFDRLVPSEKVEEKRKQLVQKLETIFSEEWPGHDIRAHLFGSSGNLLCSDDADVDICITTEWKGLERVCIIANLLARRGMENIVCISSAKVPIVKMWDPELGLACDLNVNNTLALENTRMIRVYVDTDPRVRQLAMIIKYWTRRRKINEAGIAGTYTSYTWICLIIAFLQLRTPPVLPVLHQLPYKMLKPDGSRPDFADNLKKLRGYGKQNHSSEAELLFQFFRFYAHEFDYDKYALSVKSGKLVPKADKRWLHTNNNFLCVEEPFNNDRNLGNTADEYSFRGVHLELRRAFDLISEAKFEEACELYEFPKEEEKKDFPRPRPQSRPVLLRSASQTNGGSSRGGRGGHRGGRHNNYNHRNNNSNRRTSTSVPTYDPNMFTQGVGMQQDMSWYQSPQLLQYATPEMLAQLAYQQENMRQLQSIYSQGSGYGQPMMTSQSSSGQAQPSDRSRTNSFDHPPLSAPLRPEFYMYSMPLNHPYYIQPANGYGTYPSSPATSSGSHDYRRPLQRSTVDRGVPASSSLRSQSQPASRSQPVTQPNMARQAQLSSSLSTTNVPGLAPRNTNGMTIPSLAASEDDNSTIKSKSMSPQEDCKFTGYFSPSTTPPQNSAPQLQGLSGPTYADVADPSASLSPGRRRLSTDQLPQTILDRRMRRTSRSPSPLGHTRAFSTNTTVNPLSVALNGNKDKSRPLVVNGSNGSRLKTSMTTSPPKPYVPESTVSEPATSTAFENPLHIYQAPAGQHPSQVSAPLQDSFSIPTQRPPVVLNAARAPHVQPSGDSSFRERIAMMSSEYMNPQSIAQNGLHENARFAPTARQTSRQPQNAVIAPLDLAIRDDRVRRPMGPDTSLLSPVYETRTPSPTVARKVELSGKADQPSSAAYPVSAGGSKLVPRSDEQAQTLKEDHPPPTIQKLPAILRTGGARENGHVRGARSESDSGGWQKAGKGKKKIALQQGHPETPPKSYSERKGG